MAENTNTHTGAQRTAFEQIPMAADQSTPSPATPSESQQGGQSQEETDKQQQRPSGDAEVKIPRRRFVGRRVATSGAGPESGSGPGSADGGNIEDTTIQVAKPRRSARLVNTIPDSILQDPEINDAIKLLPTNYSFEIHKTIHKIRTFQSRRVALQFPEGLLLFATTISDILTRFCPDIETLIMGDVTYGACCVDDFTARALGCDLLIHYAHSCLIPVHVTEIKTLYVFVEIGIDIEHLRATVTKNFNPQRTIAMVGTIQFNASIHKVAPLLKTDGFKIVIPQIRPLSKGEILGCTSPNLTAGSGAVSSSTISGGSACAGVAEPAADIILYVGDGRFHLESAMIHNPSLPAYRYDPYSRKLTREKYDHQELYSLRREAITKARQSTKKWGLILGSLGRQGNPHTLSLIESKLQDRGIPFVNILLSEIFPGKLAMMSDVECWVQVACPRLSIDWGYAFPRPLLSPYEALVALGVRDAGWMDEKEPTGTYPMDFYAQDGLARTLPNSGP